VKIGVISDSHDNIVNVKKVIEIFNREGINTILHLGDIISPFVVPLLNVRMVYAVFGNNDGDKLLLQKRFKEKGFRIKKGPFTISINGKRLLLMHEPFQLMRFRKEDFDFIFFGHTHKTYIEEGDTLILNPGELGGWLTGKSTYTIVDLESKKYLIRELD